jgi:hypothetical protein
MHNDPVNIHISNRHEHCRKHGWHAGVIATGEALFRLENVLARDHVQKLKQTIACCYHPLCRQPWRT